MADPVDLTPDPNAKNTLTLAQGGAIESAISTQSQLNLSGDFDPLAIVTSSTDGSGTQQTMDNTSNSAMSSSTPTSDNSNNINIDTAPRPLNDIFTNILDDYIDVMYHITLSMVSDGAGAKLRTDTVQKAEITEEEYTVFASTGDNQTDTQNDANYYNIRSFSFTSFLGIQPQNPIVATTWDGKMQIYEPYGFQLREDLRDMAQELGYSEQKSAVDYVYRMELWFSGYNPQTGEYKSQIDVPCPRPGNPGSKIKSIVYYLVVTQIEAKVTAIGTMYDLSFQTFSHYATRAEILIMHHDSILKPKGSQFRGFLQELADKMKKQVLVDTQNKIEVTYEFVGLKSLFDAKFIEDVRVDLTQSTNFNPGQGSYAASGHSVDIFTIIDNVMLNLDFVRQQLLQEQDKDFIEPTVVWNIRTNIKDVQIGPDSDNLNSAQKYVFQYIIEPVLSYRHRLPEIVDHNRHVAFENQKQRAQKIRDYGMLVRWYDFYFTSGNSEVINFEFNVKYYYYTPIYYKGSDSAPREMENFTGDLSTARADADKSNFAALDSQSTNDVTTPNLTFNPTSDVSSSSLDSQLSIASSPSNGSGANRPPNIHQHMHRGADVLYANDVSGSAQTRKSLTARDQYRRYDMLKAKIIIRGDPIWMLNPYMSGSDFTPVASQDQREKGVFVYANIDRMIYLNAYAPNQKAFMNPDLNISNTKQNALPILGGFYQVISAINRFEGGKLTQTLELIKVTNMNYFLYDQNNRPGAAFSGASGSVSNLGNGVGAADPNAANALG